VPGAEDSADADTNVSPYLGPAVTKFLVRLTELSRPPERTGGQNPLLAFNVVRVKMGRSAEYLEAVRKTKEAMDKVDYHLYYFLDEVRFGGRYHTYYFVQPVQRWADFEPQGESFAGFLKEVYGEEETRRILSVFGETVAEEHTLLLSARPDLGYTPADGM
jgi:hypothetical protein